MKTFRIYKTGNYINIVDRASDVLLDYASKDITIDRDTDTGEGFNILYKGKILDSLQGLDISQLYDESDTLYSLSGFVTFYQADTGGGLSSLENIEQYTLATANALGSTTGTAETVNKFGFNVDIDTGTEEIIASFGGAFNPLTDVITTAQTFTITYTNTLDGSTSTGARMLQFSYLDENFEAQTAFHTLGSTGSDVTSFTGVGINRIVVVSFGGALYNGGDITVTATTDATTQAQIPAEKSVTQQCIYHTPINRNLDMNYVKISTLKLSGGGGSPVVNIRGYSFSRVTSGRYGIWDMSIDTAVENNVDFNLPDSITFTGREVIYFTGETDVNNTKVEVRFSGIETDSI